MGAEFQRDAIAGKLTVRRSPVNQRYGGNQKLGYRYAIERGLDIVVLLHGDGSTRLRSCTGSSTPSSEARPSWSWNRG